MIVKWAAHTPPAPDTGEVGRRRGSEARCERAGSCAVRESGRGQSGRGQSGGERAVRLSCNHNFSSSTDDSVDTHSDRCNVLGIPCIQDIILKTLAARVPYVLVHTSRFAYRTRNTKNTQPGHTHTAPRMQSRAARRREGPLSGTHAGASAGAGAGAGSDADGDGPRSSSPSGKA